MVQGISDSTYLKLKSSNYTISTQRPKTVTQRPSSHRMNDTQISGHHFQSTKSKSPGKGWNFSSLTCFLAEVVEQFLHTPLFPFLAVAISYQFYLQIIPQVSIIFSISPSILIHTFSTSALDLESALTNRGIRVPQGMIRRDYQGVSLLSYLFFHPTHISTSLNLSVLGAGAGTLPWLLSLSFLKSGYNLWTIYASSAEVLKIKTDM